MTDGCLVDGRAPLAAECAFEPNLAEQRRANFALGGDRRFEHTLPRLPNDQADCELRQRVNVYVGEWLAEPTLHDDGIFENLLAKPGLAALRRASDRNVCGPIQDSLKLRIQLPAVDVRFFPQNG